MTLLPYKQKKQYKASHGMPGMTKEMYGASATDMILEVPCGTLIKDSATDAILAHLAQHGDEVTLIKWWRGGVGNMHFTSSRNQYAWFALMGEPGQMKDISLELTLLADVALIGTPSVGKSSLINVVSATKAKVAEYHFTTIVPNLGIVAHRDRSFVMIDIPGLIAGAASWKGLGNEFLRHVLKARIFVVCIDASRYEQGLDDASLLLEELLAYVAMRYWSNLHHKRTVTDTSIQRSIYEHDGEDARLLYHKHIIFMFTKIDLVDDSEVVESLQSALAQRLVSWFFANHALQGSWNINHTIMHCSAYIADSTHQFLDRVLTYLDDPLVFPEQLYLEDQLHAPSKPKARRWVLMPQITEITSETKPYLMEHEYLLEWESELVRVWQVQHPEICYLSFVTPRGNDEAEHRYRRTLDKEWYLRAYVRAGIKTGDVIKVVSLYEWRDDLFIKWD